MKSLRFGVIGAGWPGHQHGRAMAHVDGLDLICACDSDAERRARYAAEIAPCRMVSHHSEILRDPEIDAVIVCLPNHLHFPVSLEALQAGKHVLCEKPPTVSVAEMKTLRSEARTRGLTYGFSRQFRFSTAMLEARRLVAEGRLGHIYFGKSQWVRLRGVPGGMGGWFVDKARAGGGALIDLGVHSLDSIWYLAGCPPIRSVSAHVGAYFLEGADVEDTAFAFLRFDGGLTLSLEVAWAMNFGTAVAEPSPWWGLEATRTTLHGSAATLQISPPTICAVGSSGQVDERPLRPSRPDEYETLPEQLPEFARQLKDFATAVEEGRDPLNSADQAVELMKMLSGIYESSARGEEVRFS